MQIPGINERTVAIVSSDASVRKQLKGYLRETEKVLAKNIVYIPDDQDAIKEAFGPDQRHRYSIIFLDVLLKNMACDRLYERVCKQLNGPVVILTEPKHPLEEHLRALKASHFLNRAALSAEGLKGVYGVVCQHFRLQITLRDTQERLYASEQRFKDISDSFSDWIWEIDTGMTVQHVSKGRSRAGISISTGVQFTNCFLPEDRQKVREDFKTLFDRRKPFYDYEYWGLDLEGMRVCWSISGVPIFNDDDVFVGYRGVARDISSEKANQDQLYYLANNDTLTGIYNRGRFYDELSRAIRTTHRRKDQGAILLLDLDRFKYVNDTFGHDAGDSMLVHAAHILRESVGNQGVIARLGGDEFAVVLTHMTQEEVTQLTTHILRRMSAAPFMHSDHGISVTASAGIVFFPDQGQAAGELLSKADIAMYRAKAEGRNRWYIFDEKHLNDHGMSKRLEVVDFINKALEDGRVRPYYQPIVPLQTKKREIKHYEVLCRMVDEKGGIVLPFYFIETAEDFGLIQRIDEHMCREALKFLKDHHNIGQELVLSMNLSGITFDDEETMARIRGMVQQAGLPPGHVIFEITETTALRDIGRAQHAIRALKKVGCKLALDDFGVGYSSFSYVRHLDIDYVKIDGSFIRQINENLEDRVFVKALNDVAKGMGIETIAEMVEDGDAEEHIKTIGIDYGQGYHFGRPAPEILGETT